MPRSQETEYRLIYELSVNAGRTLSRDYLMRRVWAPREDGHPQVGAGLREAAAPQVERER